MKKVPLKNYVILGIVLIFSVIIVFIINNWLSSMNEHEKEKSIVAEIIHEIKTDDIDDYMLENPDFIIYMASRDNCTNISFEKKFKKFLIDNDLEKGTVFINLDDIDTKIYSQFIQKYYGGPNTPVFTNSIIIVEKQKIRDILNSEKFKIDGVKKFLKDNGVY